MMIKDEKAYYQSREAEEREAAKAATDPAVRDTHLMMAERYADRAAMLDDQHFADTITTVSRLRYADPT